jgi:hypothetical protein
MEIKYICFIFMFLKYVHIVLQHMLKGYESNVNSLFEITKFVSDQQCQSQGSRQTVARDTRKLWSSY